MQAKLFNLWETIRTSLWFIPCVMLFGAIFFALTSIQLDRHLDFTPEHPLVWLLYLGGADGARAILSTIAGSMITVAGVTFSITIVALTLASSQFGPRLLRNFMKDRGNQVVIGTFLSTFIYCLLVLRTVRNASESSGDAGFIPSLSIALAMVFALFNVGILIYFIHHISSSIQADQVISVVYRELLANIERLYPEVQEALDIQEPSPHFTHRELIKSDCDGYLLAIDRPGLLRLAETQDLFMHVLAQPGQFIPPSGQLAEIKYLGPQEMDLSAQVNTCFLLGKNRTPEQDLGFSIQQLVEIAVRALSPGINDPYTAMICVDHLGGALCLLSHRAFPAAGVTDAQGRLRILTPSLTFEQMLGMCFDPIRQYAHDCQPVLLRLVEALEKIAIQAENAEQSQAVLLMGQAVLSAGKGLNPKELEVLERAFKNLKEKVYLSI